MSRKVTVMDDIAILPLSGMAVTLNGSLSDTLSRKVNRTPLIKNLNRTQGISFWGKNNDFPQRINEQISKNPIIGRTLNDKVLFAQGKDVVPIFYEWDAEGKKKIKYINDPEIWDFLELYSTEAYVNEAFTDLFRFYNIFPKLTTNINRTKILRIDNEEATFCRFNEQNADGICTKVFVNANWPKANWYDPETLTYPALNPYSFDLVGEARALEAEEFILPLSYATPGSVIYQVAHWNAFLESEWNDVLLLIPAIKKYIMENEITVKFMIELPSYYFEEKFGDKYRKASEEVKLSMRMKELQAWDEFLSDVKNSGKSIASIFKVINGKEKVPGVSVTPIESKLRDGEKLKDNQEAFSLLLYALDMDPTLLGFNPGEKSSHSGTDKREAFLIFLAKIEAYRKKVLAPLNFIAKYNGWTTKYPRMKFVFEDTLLTTLDQGKSTETALSTGKGLNDRKEAA